MIVRRFAVTVILATLIAGACGGDPPPPPPPPPVNQDSIDAAREAERRAEEERRRAEEEARQREMEEQRRLEAARAAARATLTERVFFDYDESEIRDDAAQTLRAKVAILRASPQVQLRIEGHADERGTTEYNIALGNRRAEAVREFLTGFGLAENRFEIVSFGEGRPLAQGSNDASWARNRRGEFVITAGGNMINPGS